MQAYSHVLGERVKIISFKSGPLMKEFQPTEKQTGRHESCSPLQKLHKNLKVYLYALKYMYM